MSDDKKCYVIMCPSHWAKDEFLSDAFKKWFEYASSHYDDNWFKGKKIAVIHVVGCDMSEVSVTGYGAVQRPASSKIAFKYFELDPKHFRKAHKHYMGYDESLEDLATPIYDIYDVEPTEEVKS